MGSQSMKLSSAMVHVDRRWNGRILKVCFRVEHAQQHNTTKPKKTQHTCLFFKKKREEKRREEKKKKKKKLKNE
jgi:hypothetical protein